MWRHVAGVLARRYQVFVWDLLGFGASERHLQQDLSLVAHGEVLSELVERWELQHPTLIGHDIGGAVALRAHLVEGVPVSHLVLVDAVVLAPWITPRTRQMQQNLDTWLPLPNRELADLIQAHLRSATVRPPTERIARLIPGAERVVIPAAGHFSMEDQPDQISATIEAFLARLHAAAVCGS